MLGAGVSVLFVVHLVRFERCFKCRPACVDTFVISGVVNQHVRFDLRDIRSRGLGGNIAAGLRSLVGGEIHEYTELLEDTRRQALDRMVANATLMGADAVVSMRFDSSEIGSTMSEIVAYGTAVVLAADDGAPQGLE